MYIQKTFAVLVLARQLVEGQQPTLQQGVTVVYALDEAQAYPEAAKEATMLFPPENGWDNHQILLKDITVTADPKKVKGGYLHIYAILALRDAAGCESQIKLGLTHEVTSTAFPESQAGIHAQLLTICPKNDGWRDHNVNVWSKAVQFVYDDAPGHLAD